MTTQDEQRPHPSQPHGQTNMHGEENKSNSVLVVRQKKRLNPNHPFAGLQRQKPRVCNPLLSVAQRENDKSTSANMLPTSESAPTDTEPAGSSDKNEASADATQQHALQSSGDTEVQHTDDNESNWSESTNEEDIVEEQSASDDTLIVTGEEHGQGQDQDIDFVEERDDDSNTVELPFVELTTAFLRKIHRRQTKFVTWESLLATVSYAGRKNMTATQYSYLRAAVLAANSHLSFRTYKTMRTTFWSDLKHVSFPRQEIHYLGRKQHQRPCRKKLKLKDGRERNVEDCAVVILPSEWAKMDVLSYHFYHDVYESDQMHRPVSIEKSPIVQHRSQVTNEMETMWAEYKNACCPVAVGDTVSFPCNQRPHGEATKSISEGWIINERPTVNTFGERTTVTHVDGSVGPLWTVDRNSCAPKEIQPSWELSEEETAVYETLRTTNPTAPTLPSGSGGSDGSRVQSTLLGFHFPDGLFLHAGDTCTLMRPDDRASCSIPCLFVTSMLAQVGEGVAERLVWVCVASSVRDQSRRYVKILATTTVIGLPMWVRGSRSVPTFQSKVASNSGSLRSGKRYVVYRIVLYTDKFGQLKSLGDQREVGGVYILPVGLPSESKRSWSGARVVSLTPDGHSMNKVLRAIEQDLVSGASRGVEGVDPYGRPVQIFLDVVGYFGDYPAVTETTDVRGHNATAFCTFCTFREVHNAPGGSKMYSTSIHSRRLGIMRWDARRSLARSRIPAGPLERRIGFSTLDETEANKLPLVSLANSLRVAPRAKSCEGIPIVPYGYDSVQSTAAAPDHLLSGLIDDVISLCFSKLWTEEEQLRTQTIICSNARRNGLDTQGRFLKWKGNKPDGLRSVTMSTKMCILLAAAPTFRQHYQKTGKELFLLPLKLQQVVASVYESPSVETEGEEAKDAYTDEALLKACGRRIFSAKMFIHLCAREHKADPAGCKTLNKPNVHRLLELCCNTIVKYGHGLNCSEMVLESMHRRFKNWLETNPHPDSHISAVEKALSADWMGRLSILYRTYKNGNEVERACAERGLRRLLLGNDALRVETNTRPGEFVREVFSRSLDPCMRVPVLGELDLCMPMVGSAARLYGWSVEQRDGSEEESDEIVQGMEMLRSWRSAYLRGDPEDIVRYKKARYSWASKYGGWTRSYKHHTVTRGTAVSIVVDSSETNRPVIRESTSSVGGRVELYAVYGILSSSETGAWCVVKRLLAQGEGYTVRRSRVAILQLGNRARRVAVFHHCDGGCKVHAGRLKVRHSASLLNGGVYRIVRRADGYPPHLG